MTQCIFCLRSRGGGETSSESIVSASSLLKLEPPLNLCLEQYQEQGNLSKVENVQPSSLCQG